MCILFLYTGLQDESSDYSLILVSNRDEYYDRPTLNMAPWEEQPEIIGGRDLESGCDQGTWFAYSQFYKKVGVLLNLPGVQKEIAKSRGKIVADYVKSESNTKEYVDSMRSYFGDCNEFVFVTVQYSNSDIEIQTYSNATDKVETHTDVCLGFSNSLPESPLKKVEGGKHKLKDICKRLNKVDMKDQLLKELIGFLKSPESYLPDPELEKRRKEIHKELSSVFVSIPKARYGTRTHTIMLVTKKGHVDLIEITLQPPVDLSNPQ